MAPLGLVPSPQPAPEPAATEAAELQLRMEDVLASPRRLWVRGQLLGPPHAGAAPWWGRWRRRPEPPRTLQLETRISGQLFAAEVPVTPNGHFEATFAAELAPARRGWRLARHHVVCDGHRAEKCSVTLMPAEDVRGALVVVLPLAFTETATGSQRLVQSELAGRLAPLLRRFEHGPDGRHALFYLGCLPPAGGVPPVELALAATTCGWPAGNFVLLPADGQAAPDVLATGLARLRWLLAGALEVTVHNLEPAAADALAAQSADGDGLAPVRPLIQPGPDATGAAPRARRPARSSLVPRHPVVFCHGMLAFSRLRMQMPEQPNYFVHLRDFLRGRGIEAFFPQVAPTGSVAGRAEQLRDQIRRWTDEPVNLVAHSMGGLDARFLISRLGMAGRVATLTTVASPHRGSSLADWFHDAFSRRLPVVTAFEALGADLAGFRDCRRAACADYNAATPDAPGVRYFSYAAEVSQARVTPALRRAWNVIYAAEGANDGLVSSASARWGECLGVLQADHFAQTPDRVFVRPGENFDALGFFARLIEDLARRGY